MTRIFALAAVLPIFAKPTLAGGDIERGKALIKEWGCIGCHGLSGNNRSTPTRETPMLAGQPAAFLAKRIAEYKAGKHNDVEDWSKMGTLVQGLSEQDALDISAFYAAQKRY